MQLVLTRHGEVEGIDPPRFRGRAELPLTNLGRRQAQALGRSLAREFHPRELAASPMQRCRDTADEIARATGVTARVEPGINDFDYGIWQWKTHDEIERKFPREFALWMSAPQWLRFPGGESLETVALRTADALREALDHHADDTVVWVAHEGVNRVILLRALDLPLSAYWRIGQDPCCINVIEIRSDGDVRVKRMNDTAHLR